MVGTRGFEPPTTRPPAECATRLRHVPLFLRNKKMSLSSLRLVIFCVVFVIQITDFRVDFYKNRGYCRGSQYTLF